MERHQHDAIMRSELQNLILDLIVDGTGDTFLRIAGEPKVAEHGNILYASYLPECVAEYVSRYGFGLINDMVKAVAAKLKEDIQKTEGEA